MRMVDRSLRRGPRSISAKRTRAEAIGARSSKLPIPHAMELRLATTLSDSPLSRTWSTLRAGGRRALIPYLTAGYPSRDASAAAIRAAAEVADIIEVGIPFSDP